MFNAKQTYDCFMNKVEPYIGRKIGIYGTGNNARSIIMFSENKQILCVIERTPYSDSFCNIPLMSIEDAISCGIEIIVIAAESDVEVIIYRRISEICRDYGIKLIGLHLGDIENILSKHALYGYDGDLVNASIVQEEIDKHDVISFDVFDTLIMRRNVIPQDVFLKIQDTHLTEFKNFQFRRFHSEIASGIMNPSLDEIYSCMRRTYDLSNEEADELKKLEIENEKKSIVPRKSIIQLFEYAKRKGKRIFLISDMYMSPEYLKNILITFGVKGYEDILVSNVYRTTKNEDLYEVFVKRCEGQNCLHIGDHSKIDGLNAVAHGIDAIVLPSALELFKRSQYSNVLRLINTSNERALVGLFVLRMFSDPFERDYKVSNARDYGYLFIGPLISVFMTWLIEAMRKQKYTKILFASRDGYLFLKLYKKAVELMGLSGMPEGIYFYTSRRACLRAYCRSDDNLEEVLKQYTFSIDDISRNFSESEEYVKLSKEEVFRRSLAEYEGYKAYISNLDISSDDNIAFIDLISGGTCQYYLEEMFFGEMTGHYLCRGLSWVKRPPYIKALTEEHPNDPAAYFSKIEQVTLLEAVMTSPEPSLAGFTLSGNPVFLDDKSLDDDNKFVEEVQLGISEYFEVYLKYLYVEGSPVHLSIVKELMSYRNIAEVDDSILSHIYLADELLGVQFGRKRDNAKEH